MKSLSFLTLSGVLALHACGTKSDSSLHITNGIVIEEREHPEVINLYRRVYENGKLKGGATCTGTWIGENTILTAAHCTGDGPSDADGKVQNLEIVVFEITDHTTDPKQTRLVANVLEAYRNKLWETRKGYNRYDLAILKTAAQGADERPRGQASITHAPVLVGDDVSIVGYGYYDMSTFGKKGDDRKRIGSNTIASIKEGFLNIEGAVKNQSGGATGEGASAGNGDSGGPMFHEGALVGVASGGGTGGLFSRGEASYVDLNTAESRAFLARFGY